MKRRARCPKPAVRPIQRAGSHSPRRVMSVPDMTLQPPFTAFTNPPSDVTLSRPFLGRESSPTSGMRDTASTAHIAHRMIDTRFSPDSTTSIVETLVMTALKGSVVILTPKSRGPLLLRTPCHTHTHPSVARPPTAAARSERSHVQFLMPRVCIMGSTVAVS